MTDSRRGPSTVRMVLELAGAVIGIVMVAAAPNPPVSWLQWTQVLVGATLSAGITILAGLQAAGRHRPEPGDDPAPGPGTAARLRQAADRVRDHRAKLFALLLLAVVGSVAGPPVVDLGRGLVYQVRGCPLATQLRVVAEPETLPTAQEVARAYERASAGADHGCPAVQLFVFGATPATIARRLQSTDGWSDASGALRQVGPRPDVWLASTGHEVDALATGNGPGPVVDRFPVARSPLVLAVAAPAARAAGRPANQPADQPADQPLDQADLPGVLSAAQPDVGWPELFRRTTDAGPGVARPDPSSGELGRLATALLYGGGEADPAPLAPAEVERRLDSTLDGAGLPIGDAADLLCRRRAAPAGAGQAAVIASEQDVARFNKGLPLGDSCGAVAEPAAPDRRLAALYPTDTGDQDLQFVRLVGGGPAQQQAAVAFGAWLRGDGGRDALVGTGLRPVGAFARADPLTPEFGVDPTRSPSSEPVAAARRQAADEAYRRLQRPSRLLFLLDTSGSMTTQAPDGTRAQAAAAAVRAGLRRLGPRDEFGLWFFPGSPGPTQTGTGHTEAVPPGPRTDARLATAGQALDAVAPSGSTPLFRAVVDGVAALSRDGGTDARALVVLTDGADTTSGISADDTARAVADRGVRVVVVTLGEIRCTGGGLPTVVASTGGDCVDADTVTVGAQLPEVVGRLRGGG